MIKNPNIKLTKLKFIFDIIKIVSIFSKKQRNKILSLLVCNGFIPSKNLLITGLRSIDYLIKLNKNYIQL